MIILENRLIDGYAKLVTQNVMASVFNTITLVSSIGS